MIEYQKMRSFKDDSEAWSADVTATEAGPVMWRIRYGREAILDGVSTAEVERLHEFLSGILKAVR